MPAGQGRDNVGRERAAKIMTTVSQFHNSQQKFRFEAAFCRIHTITEQGAWVSHPCDPKGSVQECNEFST